MTAGADAVRGTPVRVNLLANFASRGWSAAVALLAVPLVVQKLGYEAYGLVGFYGTLQALILLLDLGLSFTLNRELARLRAAPGAAAEMGDVMRTLETVYWAIGLAVFALLAPLAPWLARNWLQPVHLPEATVQLAIVMMLAAVAARLPLTLYSGGLAGLQRQVPLAWITAVMTTVQNLGAVAALYVIAPTLQVFFAWQLGAALLHTLAAGATLWRLLPPSPVRPSFRRAVLRRVGGFAASTGATSILAVALQYLDRVILSRLLPLEAFGYYTLASVAAGALYRLIEPVFVVFYPRLTELVAHGTGVALAAFYHRASQFVALLVIPAATVLAAFAPEALRLWTQDPSAATHSAALLSILAAGTALNGLVSMPYALQLASNWPQLSLRLNLIALAAGAPLMWGLTHAFGARGAASVWILVNAYFLVAAIHLMHRRVLPGEEARWYRDAVLVPIAAATATGLAARVLWSAALGTWATAAALAGVGVVTLAATAAVLPAVRHEIDLRFGGRRHVRV